MRSHIEFRSQSLLDADNLDENVDKPHGRSVSDLLATQLPTQGYLVKRVGEEDWGWRIDLDNAGFPLWIGCAHYQEYSDGHLCFIEPSRPFVRRWLKSIATTNVVEPLATAVERILHSDARISELRWWTDAEVNLGRG